MSLYAKTPMKASYRHVVFVDPAHERRSPMNFGPSLPIRRAIASALMPQELSFTSWLFDRAGLRVSRYRQETIARRLPACLRMIRAHCISEARNILDETPSLIPVAIGALVIGVTSFFRDPLVFQNLRKKILPAMAHLQRPLRIWSAGCSDGQEMYSLAMLLAEMGWLNRVDLLGTDCRTEAARHATAGIYSDADVRGVPGDFLKKYFDLHERGWRIIAPLRTVVRWRSADVLQVIEPGAWDMILCRNFAMYLEPEPALLLWQRLRRSLRPGGSLVVGKAERPGVDGLRPIAPCIFSRNCC
ncbi:MAG TPA: CheR family methyltransferase [Tepidisphaeraceae bacterium]